MPSVNNYFHGWPATVGLNRTPAERGRPAGQQLHAGCAEWLSLHIRIGLQEARPSILHRDVKSTNILLDEADYACVGDLGLARSAAMPHHRHGHTADTLNGTFGYVAPEFFLNGEPSASFLYDCCRA